MKKYHRPAGLIWINQDVQRRQADFIMVRKDEWMDKNRVGVQGTLQSARCRSAADDRLQPLAGGDAGPADGGG